MNISATANSVYSQEKNQNTTKIEEVIPSCISVSESVEINTNLLSVELNKSNNSNGISIIGEWGESGYTSIEVKDNIVYYSQDNTLNVYNYYDPNNPIEIKKIKFDYDLDELYISDNFLFVGLKNNGIKLYDISDENSPPKYLSSFYSSNKISNFQFNSNFLYALVGNNVIVKIDYNQPDNPIKIGEYVDTSWDRQWNRIIDFQIVDNNAYLLSKNQGFKILDITDISNSHLISYIGQDSPSCGNSSLYVIDNFVYLLTNNVGLITLDISDNSSPKITNINKKIPYANDLYMIGNSLYSTSVITNSALIDIKDPANPVIKEIVTFSTHGLNESNNRLYYLESKKGIRVFDNSFPSYPVELTNTSNNEFSGYVHEIALDGDFIYAANGYDGLKKINVSNSRAPKLESILDTGYVSEVRQNNNHIYYTNGNYLKRMRKTGSNEIDLDFGLSEKTFNWDVNNKYLVYKPNIESLVYSLNLITDELLTFNVSGYIESINVNFDRIFIDGDNPKIYDLKNKESLIDWQYQYIYGDDKYLITNPNNIAEIYDISNVTNPGKIFYNDTRTGLFDAKVVDDYLYLMWGNEITVYDISDISNPTIITTKVFGNSLRNLIVKDHLIYVSSFVDGLYILQSNFLLAHVLDEVSLTDEYQLLENYPNPFNPETNIIINLKNEANVKLKIFNSTGKLVKTLVNERLDHGFHTIKWDGTNDNGLKVSSGSYFYQLVSNGKVITKKMLLIK